MLRPLGFLLLLACVACHGKEAEAPSGSPSVSQSSSDASTSSALAAPAPSLPPELERLLPEHYKLRWVLNAKGVQIYGCVPKPAEPGAFEWKLKAPEADLFNEHGEKVATHFTGPTWQATDGSKVVGVVAGKIDAPDARAIPWLLLTGTAAGVGMFSAVVNVARLDTIGGKAPKEGCDAAHADAEVRVPYSAKYRFYSQAAG